MAKNGGSEYEHCAPVILTTRRDYAFQILRVFVKVDKHGKTGKDKHSCHDDDRPHNKSLLLVRRYRLDSHDKESYCAEAARNNRNPLHSLFSEDSSNHYQGG